MMLVHKALHKVTRPVTVVYHKTPRPCCDDTRDEIKHYSHVFPAIKLVSLETYRKE